MRAGSASILARPRAERTPGDQRVPERDAEVAQHGRIGEIALPARDRQLLGEMAQQRIGDPAVAFRILEIDRIDLVRHGGGADLAGHGALAQVAEGDVAPDIAAQVDEDDVDGGERIAVFGDPVVRLDLRRPGVVFEASEPTKPAATAGQSRPGTRHVCALKLPTAPFHLPRIATAAKRRCARFRRAANSRISLPRVVGLAGWPWVRAGIAASA